MSYAFHPAALTELREAILFYGERKPGLGQRFAASLQAALAKIQAAPGRFPLLEEDIHRCLVHSFPYAVLYTIEPNFILVIAVMHTSREPGYWRQRLDPR